MADGIPTQARLIQGVVLRIILIYLGFFVLWFLMGEALIACLVRTHAEMLFACRLKDWLFIPLSALLLFFLLRRCFLVQASAAAELRQHDDSLNCVLEGGRLAVWDWDIGSNEIKRNHIWAEMLGYTYEELAVNAHDWTDFIHPDDRDRAWQSIHNVLNGTKPVHELTYRMLTKSGEYKWIMDRGRIVERDQQGKPVRMSGTQTDVDKLIRAEEALEASETRFRAIFENAAVGIALISLDGVFIDVNDALCHISGFSREELRTRPVAMLQLAFPCDLGISLSDTHPLFDASAKCHDVEHQCVRKDQSIAWVHFSASLVRDAQQQPQYIVCAFQDISAQKKLQDELEIQARLDSLTGVNNRRYFLDLSVQELSRATRYGSQLSLLMIDIDHFKQVNDTRGHKAGDLVLQRLGQLMREGLREVDIIGRLGGEEFAILLPETGGAHAFEVAERLRERVAHTRIAVPGGDALSVTISIGVSSLASMEADIDTLLIMADKGLYRAKASGRNKVIL